MVQVDCSVLPCSIVQALASLAEAHDDPYCKISLETLAEIAVTNPKLISESGVMRTIVGAIVDPLHQDLQDSLVACLLYLLNQGQTRFFLRPHSDLKVLFSVLTEPHEQINQRKELWSAALRAISAMIRSFTGLISLSADDFAGLKSLVIALTLPYSELHEMVLDTLFGIFRLPLPKGKEAFNRRGRTNVENRTSASSDQLGGGLDLPSRTFGERPNLLQSYLATLLVAFVHCGLLEALVTLGQEHPKEPLTEEASTGNNGSASGTVSEASTLLLKRYNIVPAKATVLLAEMLHMTNSLLPATECARLQTLPTLISHAVSFTLQRGIRASASGLVRNLHQFSHIKGESSYFDFHLSLIVTGANKWRRLKGRDRRLDRIDDVKRKIDWGMDDRQLLAKLQQTQILVTKDYTKWEWDFVTEVLEGPLRNPVHLSAAMKTKFIKRILSFLRPSNHLFSTETWTVTNVKYVRVACLVLEVLLSTEEGASYLEENALIKQIAELLRVEVEGKPDRNPRATRLLSPERVLKTMAREYFTMLGTLSSTSRGLEIMKKLKIFNYLRPMIDLQGRDDLSFLILTSLDYNIGGHSRVLLSKSLTSTSRVVRYLATRHMRVLLRAGVANFAAWGVEFLVKQLSDSDTKVGHIALSVLDEACDEEECLEGLIAKQPAPILLQMGKPGRDLLLRLLSSPQGLAYLLEQQFIEEALKKWKDNGNVEYVVALEEAIENAFSSSVWREKGNEQLSIIVNLHPHLYGELAKTSKGCDILKEQGDLQALLSAIQDSGLSPLQRRAALWAIGQIAASETGLAMLKSLQHNVIQYLVRLAETEPCLSIRGTCIYLLGIIAITERGRQELEALAWDTPVHVKCNVCLPRDVPSSPFFQVERPSNADVRIVENKGIQGSSNVVTADIMTWIGNLSNHIVAERAMINLKRAKVKHAEEFQKLSLAMDVLKALESYKFRLPVRRFIYSLIDDCAFDSSFFVPQQSSSPSQQPCAETKSQRKNTWVFPTIIKEGA
jgi:rapamycin-insensitive companion of mTOR